MNKIFVFLCVVFGLISCQNEKKIVLPKVNDVSLSEMFDYSVIYVFYDEQTHKGVLNKNNLITSTHWVFHIDNRLTMSDAGAKIVQMQEKKEKPGPHNNPDSRNFFSVADSKDNQLKFIEFTKTRFRLCEAGDDFELKPMTLAELATMADNLTKTHAPTPEKITIKGSVSFQDFVVFLHEVQKQGAFFKTICIVS